MNLSDQQAIFFIVVRKLFLKLICVYSTFILRILLMLKGIKFGHNTRFYGFTSFVRFPNSLIVIGKNAVFRSGEVSNLIGVNRRCILSTQLVGATLMIGNNCGFSGTVIGAFSKIIIGNNVRCGANTLITDSDWHLDDYRSSTPKPIIIEDNVWLGVNSVVLKGVTIGKNSVIGANSVVTKSIPPNVIAAGNPCSVIKNITNDSK
ncbi:MAG: acyltransferase [Bacteroidales bacterium]|nr:acyltransferase [Acholeplasmataceae bacterium]MCK9448817.1 acyltransferase [Bacteroidales bacterium]